MLEVREVEKETINILLERIDKLEKRVATLEGQVQEQPKFIPEDSVNGKHFGSEDSMRRPNNY